MARIRTTPNAKLSPKYGTSSGTNPEENFESPEDLSDVAGIDAEIPRGNARPTGSLLEPKPKPRSPIGVEIGKSAGGGLGVVVAVPLGGGPISGRGGINLGAGGAIKGGSIGLGFGLGPIGGSIDVGVDQDEKTGQGGCYQYVTLAAGPFSHTYGRNVCEPKPPSTSSLLPTTPAAPAITNTFRCNNGEWVLGGVVGTSGRPQTPEAMLDADIANWYLSICNPHLYSRPAGSDPSDNSVFRPQDPAAADFVFKGAPYRVEVQTIKSELFVARRGDYYYYLDSNPNSFLYSNMYGNQAIYFQRCFTQELYIRLDGKGTFNGSPYNPSWEIINIKPVPRCPNNTIPVPVVQNSTNPPSVLPLSPPVPNPPPRKKMDDKCCKQSLILQVEILRLLGRELGPEGLVPQTKKAGFIGEEFERVETPILDPNKPKKIKVRFETVYELLMYALKQANNLDTALDPQSYKPPTGKVQNPAYNRDSEQSLKSNTQPGVDKAGNKRELEINKDKEVKMGGFLEQQQYIFNAIKRLEYLFPFGELSDAVIAKDLLIPGGKGDIKIHNMIMAYEIQMMYFNATLGNPREILTIKDSNPAIKGDQPIEVTALTLSDWFRQVVKFQIDTGGDVDAAVNLMLRDFRTNLANRIDIIKTAEMTQALFEDSGMREQQDYIEIHLEGDPYAGQWIKGQGFKANPDLEKKTEEATEKVLRETMNPTDIKIKVSRRHKEEKTDMRDLLRGLADFVQRLLSVPSAGDAGTAIDKLIESAKFKVQTEAALLRQNITKAATASRNRTRKRKK